MPVVKKQSAKRKTRRKSSRNGSLLSQASEIEFESEGLKVALYGRSGTGKTTFWATFPKPILAIICSGGKRSGELRSVQNIKGISKFDLSESSQIIELAAELEESKYKTVVLDHATYLQDLTLKEILGLDDVPVQSSWGLASQQQYGQVAIQMKELLRRLLDLSQNVVIVAQEREFGTDSESDLILPSVGCALTPSITGWLNPACDYIFQTYIGRRKEKRKVKIGGKVITKEVAGDKVDYFLRTGPNDVYTTKFRVPKGHNLPNEVCDPSYEKIVSIIQG